MRTKTNFKRADTLILFICVIFLLLNVGAISRRGRTRAKDLVCQANLNKWGAVFSLYAEDYDGYNPYGDWSHSWWRQILPYMQPDVKQRKLFYCPAATETSDPQPFTAWSSGYAPLQFGGGRYQGSYGINPWIFSFTGNSGSRFGGFDPDAWRWKRPDVAGADNVPVFGDCATVGGAPRDTDIPQQLPDQSPSSSRKMQYWCLDRHDCVINMVFMDWSVRRVPLKCLWKLKWHRQFNTETSGPVEGEPYPVGWPDWMADCSGCD
jgi:hypothetical protein